MTCHCLYLCRAGVTVVSHQWGRSFLVLVLSLNQSDARVKSFEEIFVGTCSLSHCGLALYHVSTANLWIIFLISWEVTRLVQRAFQSLNRILWRYVWLPSSLLLLSVCFMTASCSVLLCPPETGLVVLSACTTTPSSPFFISILFLDHVSSPFCHPTLFLCLFLFACLSDCAPCAYSTLRGQGGYQIC